jgi:hypothetical protein
MAIWSGIQSAVNTNSVRKNIKMIRAFSASQKKPNPNLAPDDPKSSSVGWFELVLKPEEIRPRLPANYALHQRKVQPGFCLSVGSLVSWSGDRLNVIAH